MMADGFPLPGAEGDGTPGSTGQQRLVALLESPSGKMYKEMDTSVLLLT